MSKQSSKKKVKFSKDMKTSDLPIPSFSLTEIALFQVLVYGGLWVISDYTATLLTVIFPSVFSFILIIALLAEMIDRSKISRWYFKLMGISIVIPIITALAFIAITGTDFDWTKL